MATPTASEKRATLREKIAARRKEREAEKTAASEKTAAVNKYARVRQVAAEEPQAAADGLEQLGDAFGQLGEAVQALRENLDLVEAPVTASLKERIASKRSFAKAFRQIAEQNPEMLEGAIAEVYHSLDEVAVALENYAENMGLNPSLDETVLEEPVIEEKIEEPVVEEETKEAAAGADAFSSDRDHDGHPKEASGHTDSCPRRWDTSKPCDCGYKKEAAYKCPECEHPWANHKGEDGCTSPANVGEGKCRCNNTPAGTRAETSGKYGTTAAAGSDNFVTDRDDKGEPKAPQRVEVPRLAARAAEIVKAAMAAVASHKAAACPCKNPKCTGKPGCQCGDKECTCG